MTDITLTHVSEWPQHGHVPRSKTPLTIDPSQIRDIQASPHKFSTGSYVNLVTDVGSYKNEVSQPPEAIREMAKSLCLIPVQEHIPSSTGGAPRPLERFINPDWIIKRQPTEEGGTLITCGRDDNHITVQVFDSMEALDEMLPKPTTAKAAVTAAVT